MTQPEIKQLLALDVGMVRTGVARASVIAALPEPLMTLPTNQLIDELPKLIKKYSIDAIVIGLPRSMDGNETAQTAWVRQWVADIKPNMGIALFLQDEAATTVIAQQGNSSPAGLDAHAAAIILNDFLATPADQRHVV